MEQGDEGLIWNMELGAPDLEHARMFLHSEGDLYLYPCNDGQGQMVGGGCDFH